MAGTLSLEGSSYLGQMGKWAERDAKRLSLMRNAGSGGTIFSNVEFPLRINCLLFEAKAAMAVPTKYYQGLKVDRAPLRNDWAHDFCRSIAFVKGGLLLVSKAVASTGTDTLLHYHAVKFSGNEYSFTDLGNERFEVTVNAVTKQGRDLMRDAEASHTFDFTFRHNPIRTARLSPTSFRASGLASEVYERHGGLARAARESVVTVAHLEPHPYLLADFAHFGYKSKNEFQDSVGELLRSFL